eukprot:GHVO01056188.1.p1 GENE.GHVO01056188.1~~GHVO01056188.1.p1  ORF type:complete len:126 (-),score=2.58 GHVO01056188.1:1047-1424(-)
MQSFSIIFERGIRNACNTVSYILEAITVKGNGGRAAMDSRWPLHRPMSIAEVTDEFGFVMSPTPNTLEYGPGRAGLLEWPGVRVGAVEGVAEGGRAPVECCSATGLVQGFRLSGIGFPGNSKSLF